MISKIRIVFELLFFWQSLGINILLFALFLHGCCLCSKQEPCHYWKEKKKQNFLQTIVHPLKTFSCSAQANLHVLEYQLGNQTQNTDGYATD